MLRVLRSGGAGQALMGLIVIAIIFVFLLEFRTTSRMQTGSIKRECAAQVGAQCITPKDFFAEFGLVVPRGMTAKQVKSHSLRRRVAEGVVERELLIAEAEKLGLSVDEESTKKELRLGRAHVSLPATDELRFGHMLDLVTADEHGIVRDLVRELPVIDAKTQEIDDELYGRVVRSMTNRSPKEFLKMQRRELLAARMRDLVRSRVRVSDEEGFDAFQRERSKAVVRSARLQSEWFARYAVDPSDAGVDRWADEHKAQVDEAWKAESAKWQADCPIASEIVVLFPSSSSEADKTLAQERIERAKGLLDKGEPFELVARQVSEGPTAAGGGAIGCLTPDAYREGGDVLAKAVSALAPRAVSDIVETKAGYHLVRFEGRLPVSEVESVGRRGVARRLMVRTAGEETAKQFAAKVVETVKSGARLDDTVKALTLEYAKPTLAASGGAKKSDKSATVGDEPAPLKDARAPKTEISAPFPIDGDPVPELFGAAALARIAFQLEKPDDVHSEPIAVPGGFVLLQLKEKTLATRDEFTPAKGEIMRKLEIAKRSDALIRYVARLRQNTKGKIEVSDRILEDPKSADAD
jgi:peptidyl-prolyl cis-trans isomerase D